MSSYNNDDSLPKSRKEIQDTVTHLLVKCKNACCRSNHIKKARKLFEYISDEGKILITDDGFTSIVKQKLMYYYYKNGIKESSDWYENIFNSPIPLYEQDDESWDYIFKSIENDRITFKITNQIEKRITNEDRVDLAKVIIHQKDFDKDYSYFGSKLWILCYKCYNFPKIMKYLIESTPNDINIMWKHQLCLTLSMENEYYDLVREILKHPQTDLQMSYNYTDNPNYTVEDTCHDYLGKDHEDQEIIDLLKSHKTSSFYKDKIVNK